MKTQYSRGAVLASFLALFTSTFLAAGQSGGSVPVITAFSPASGAAGMVVNIRGINFSPTAANNVVYFGAVQATVQFASPTNLVVTVPAGATFAPITETVNGLTAYAEGPFVPTFPASASANFSLGSQLVLPAGGSPSGVVIADFDGDGKPDLAVDNGNSGTIEIYRNISASGSLAAGSFAPPVILPIGTGGSSPMVAADLTGDGKLDLICQDINSNLVVVIKNLCTPGNITSNSFAAAVTFAVGNGPRGVAVQDLDGDGKPEIVSANFGDSTVSVLRNTSTPGIITSSSFAPPVAFATGTDPQDVMIADIDGDGHPDLVTVDNNYYETSPGFSVLRNISTSTNINFESHVDFAGIQDTYCIAIGDLDGDGKPDVVIGSQGGNGPDGNSISIYRNTSTPGNITSNSFAPAVNIPAGGWVNSVALGDLNGDGKLDIAAAMQIPSQLAVFLNTSTPGSISNNSFSAPLVFASGYNANGIAIGDLNGDGIPDIAFANSYDGTASVYQNLTSSSGSGGIPPYITTQPNDQTVTAGSTATFSVTAGGTAPLSYQWFFDGTNVVGTNATLTLDDVSSADAGVYQVFVASAYGSTDSVPATLTVTSSTTNGNVPVITAFSPALGATGTVVNISGLNFSPTAANNVVYFGAVQAPVESASATSLQVEVPAGATFGPITETVNGLTAYAQTPFLPTFPGNTALSANTFAPGFNLAAGNGPIRVLAADLDGDGKPDLIVADDYGDDVLIYQNVSSNGTLSAASFAPPVELPVGPAVSQNDAILGLAVGDLAGNGHLDIVVANRYTSEISIFQNLSSPGVLASNSFGTRIDIPVAGNPGAVSIMDVDGDGQPDVVTANYYGNSVSVLRNIAAGGLLNSNSFAPPISFATGPGPYSLAVGDLDGDGEPDIITGAGDSSSLSNTISVLRNVSTPGNIVLQPHQDFPGLGQANSVVIGDLDGDGKPDLAVSSGSSGQALSVYRNISTPGAVTLAPPVNFGLGGWGNTIAIGDMDGDGKPDIAVETQLPSQICLFRNTSVPGAFTTSSLAPPIVLGSGWNPNGIVLADLLGDGRPDLIFANTYDGTLTIEQNLSAFGAGTAPYIIAQPTDQTVTAGNTATFSVTAGGTAPLNYQWFFDGTNLVGTNATLSLDDASTADEGSYQAFISNAYGSTNSVPVTLTVNSSSPPPMAPTITAQSTNQTIMAGGTAYLSVAAEGTAPLSYQWFFNETNLVGTNETLTLDDVNAADTGIYQALVENAYGAATSAPITLTVSSASSSCYPAPSGIVAWWPAEGNADDVIGTNNGTLEGSVGFGPGEVGQAFLYTTTNDAVRVPASPSLNVGTGSGFTVEGWINPSDVSQLHCIFEWNNGTSFGVHFYVSADPAPGTLYANVVDSSGYWHQMNSSVSPVTANVFQHVALTYDEASGTATMYYNGAIVGQQYLGSYTPQTSYDLYLGRRPPGIDSTWTFSGLIDEPSVYNRALSSSEVAAIYQAGSEGKCRPVPTQGNPNIPAISSFSPTIGAAGTAVNISGLNFSTIASNNIVYFGAVQAPVESASATSLQVKVPAGATYAPITETVNGLTAYAGAPFVPTFATSAPTNFSLGPQLVMTASNMAWFVVIADLDGDGKPDLAVNNGDSHTIDIYRNISAGGTITSNSFAPPVVLPIGTGGQNVMIAADLTGDGKLDLVCLDENSNLVMVLKNLCTPGNISFAPAVTFASGTDPRGVAVQDLDGDGKPELVVANCGDSTVSVMRNLSTPGTINANSFASPVVFATGTRPQDVMIADIDGDGQPDLVTVNNNYYENSPSMSVLRNISTSTNINFESHVDFAGIQDTYCIAIGDLDGDGKPDVVIGSQGGNGPDGNSVSIYRNTSTPGNITSNSFAPAVNIPAGGWVNSVALGDLNGDGKLDIAAAMQIPSQLAVFLNTSTPGSISNNSFSSPLVFASGYNANGIAIGDLNGDGLPDIAFANSYDGTFSIYQNLTASGGGTIVATQTLDHFSWNPIPSPQVRSTRFTITITARDAHNDIFTNFTGSVHISSTNKIPVVPPVLGGFVHGSSTGMIMVPLPATNVVLSATDVSKHTGISNPFNVITRPLLKVPFANGMQIAWPASSAGFVLEMTTNLASGNWVIVPGQPLQSSNMYLQPMTPAITNSPVFYRLQYIGQ